jgi:hypothetical protein
MKRRDFILFGAGLSITPLVSACRNDSKWLPLLSKPTTVTQFCDQAELLSIGQAYTQMHPVENDRIKLQDLILQDLRADTDQQLLANLDKKKRQEFSTLNTVIVKGWVLSRTEARQCALYTLTAK